MSEVKSIHPQHFKGYAGNPRSENIGLRTDKVATTRTARSSPSGLAVGSSAPSRTSLGRVLLGRRWGERDQLGGEAIGSPDTFLSKYIDFSLSFGRSCRVVCALEQSRSIRAVASFVKKSCQNTGLESVSF